MSEIKDRVGLNKCTVITDGGRGITVPNINVVIEAWVLFIKVEDHYSCNVLGSVFDTEEKAKAQLFKILNPTFGSMTITTPISIQKIILTPGEGLTND